MKRLVGGHPWVYRTDLPERFTVPSARLVHLQDGRGRFLASALSSSASQISFRVIADRPLKDDSELAEILRDRVREAVAYRARRVVGGAYRVIFSEADGLPGVIADRYNDVITLQLLTQAMNREDIQSVIIAELEHAYPMASIVERTEPRIRRLEALRELESRIVRGKISDTIFDVNGLAFHFAALGGQKTGAFLDQRENYAAAEAYARGEALDVFCYQGGFALHLARKCPSVMAVDSSREALETAERNEQLNRAGGRLKADQIAWTEADAFLLLRDFAAAGRQFDTIVLDPPAFAKSKRAGETAVRGYKEINLRALRMLRPGGVLLTNSCSHHVSETEFLHMLGAAAIDSRRFVRVIEKRTQAVDHPIVPTIPETAYLKCVICEVR